MIEIILFSISTTSLNAVEEEVYSLNELPFAEITKPKEASPIVSDAITSEEDRLMLLDNSSIFSSSVQD